jgi:hypothetical protein
MSTILDELKIQEEKNKKYFLATYSLLLAYQNLKGEDQYIDMFLLATAQEISKRIDMSDKKMDEDIFINLLNTINGTNPDEATVKINELVTDLQSFIDSNN